MTDKMSEPTARTDPRRGTLAAAVERRAGSAPSALLRWPREQDDPASPARAAWSSPPRVARRGTGDWPCSVPYCGRWRDGSVCEGSASM